MWPQWLLTSVMNNIIPSICISPNIHSAGTSGVVDHSCKQQMDKILGHTDVNTLCERKMIKKLITLHGLLYLRLRIQIKPIMVALLSVPT